MPFNNPFIKLFGTSLFFLMISVPVMATVSVVTTTSDLADIARSIGKSHVKVTSLTDGRQDPHEIEARPSMVTKVRHADLMVVIGMELDGWSASILRTANNPQILPGQEGYVDASHGIKKIASRVNAAAPGVGDVHQSGNPHYWLDPNNGIIIGDEIRDALVAKDPDHREDYDRNFNEFAATIRAAIPQWKQRLASSGPVPILSFHSSWDYFLNAFGLRNVGTVEVYPGMGSLGIDLGSLKSKIAKGDYKVLIYEPAQAKANADLFKHLSATSLTLTPLVPSVTDGVTGSYFQLIDHDVEMLRVAMAGSR